MPAVIPAACTLIVAAINAVRTNDLMLLSPLRSICSGESTIIMQSSITCVKLSTLKRKPPAVLGVVVSFN